MSKEQTTPQNTTFVIALLSLVVGAILIVAIIVSANDDQRVVKLYKELHQCWTEKLNG